MSTYLNSGSFVIGFAAWFLPLVYIRQYKNPRISIQENMFLSFMMMGIALIFQLMYQQHLASINDTIAILDIIDGVVFVSWILFLGTLILNIIAVAYSRKRT